jgi:hypothetical protein
MQMSHDLNSTLWGRIAEQERGCFCTKETKLSRQSLKALNPKATWRTYSDNPASSKEFVPVIEAQFARNRIC